MSSGLLQVLSEFLRWNLMIFFIKGFRTIVFIFIVISTTFRPKCPPAFFRCLLSKFLRRSWMIFIFKGFQTIVFIFMVYFHNVSADMSSGLHQVFVELGNQHGISNYVLYWIRRVTCSDSVNHNRVQVLSIPVLLLTCSQDWTCNLQMIVSLEA